MDRPGPAVPWSGAQASGWVPGGRGVRERGVTPELRPVSIHSQELAACTPSSLQHVSVLEARLPLSPVRGDLWA